MNINLIRFKPVIRELAGIRMAVERLADCWEHELAAQGLYVRAPKADTSGPEPTMSYTSEEEDAFREINDYLRREDDRKTRDEEENDPFGIK